MRIFYAFAVFGKEEEKAVQNVLKKRWLGVGPEVREFERRVARVFGKKYGVMVNSGSSANLLALCAAGLPGKTDVITPALTFATTVAPILQTRLNPVFVDSDLGTYQANIKQAEEELSRSRARRKILMIPALLGNLPDIEQLRKMAKKQKAVFILDSCDTIGGSWKGGPFGKYADIVTVSFYPSHVITAAGGGMVMTDDEALYKKFLVLRGWGRASALWEESEKPQKRFNYKVDGIPYDAKFVYLEQGFNLQPNEIQGAFGLAQIKKLTQFTRQRIANFKKLSEFFRTKKWFMLPRQYPQTKTNWLAFPLTLLPGCPFTRSEITLFLEQHDIQTRPLFAGNIMRHPGFRHSGPEKFKNADYAMRNSFVIGCHQGLTQKHLNYLFRTFDEFLKRYE